MGDKGIQEIHLKMAADRGRGDQPNVDVRIEKKHISFLLLLFGNTFCLMKT